MTAIYEVASFARDYINHSTARTPDRKAKIRQAILKITGQRLGNGCSTCYIEAIFKILKYTQMANYELRKGYVAQFAGHGVQGIKSFTNLNLQTNPAKYDPIAAEYLRLYPERAIYFSKTPKIVEAGIKIYPEPKSEPTVAPEGPNPMKVFHATLEGATLPKTARKHTKKTK
jgi:hypothetical protein